ncbi:MAG TPA: NAD-dependent epimerase/dehydratase family protein, partial [Polyangia bacterium]
MAKRDSVLVIGGSGFIGRVLVAQLLERGCAVRVMSRRAGRDDGSVQYVQGDVSDRASILRAADGIDVVYDLSMAFGETWADYERTMIKGAENVASVVLERGIRRLIYTSTIAGLYLAKAGSVDESAGPDPKPELRSWYARAKILAEGVLGKLHRERALPVVVFRPGIVVGVGNKLSHPGIGVWVSPTVCSVVGNGCTPLPMVLVEDVAQALVLAKDAPGVDGKTFNLAGDVRPSAAEYVAIAAERSKRNFRLAPKSPLSIQAFRTVVWLGKKALGRKDNVWQSYYELKNAPQRTWLDCAAAKQLLG